METSFSRAKDGIYADAFVGCTNLTSVYFAGDETQWTSLSSKISSTFNGAKIYFYLADEDATPALIAEDKYWHYVNDVPTAYDIA